MTEPTFTETFGCTPVAGDPVCPGCGNVIDPDCCGCGDSREGHDSMWSGHSFVPMGCDCMREPNRELQDVLADALATVNPEAK